MNGQLGTVDVIRPEQNKLRKWLRKVVKFSFKLWESIVAFIDIAKLKIHTSRLPEVEKHPFDAFNEEMERLANLEYKNWYENEDYPVFEDSDDEEHDNFSDYSHSDEFSDTASESSYILQTERLERFRLFLIFQPDNLPKCVSPARGIF